jgi:hypothetical protein
VPAFAASKQAERERLTLPCRPQAGALEQQRRIGRGANAGNGAIVCLGHGLDLFSRLQVNVD